MNLNYKKYLQYLAFISLLFLVGCSGGGSSGSGSDGNGGGGSGSPSGTTTFAGGSLDDLKVLSPTLTFGDLIITGYLSLPINTSTTLTVNSLALTTTGSIGYTYSTCTYSSAPDLEVNAAGDVSIVGDISLTGRYGTSVTSGASCNSCYGQNGGDITISAANLSIAAQLDSYGGNGGTYRDSYGSSGCSGGNSGHVTLTANNIDLSGAGVVAHGGRGGAQGFDYGPSGSPGNVSLQSSGRFKMNPGSIGSDGAMMFRAAQTEIYGPITYGTLNGLINGVGDLIAPVATILAPVPGATIPLGQPLQIQVQASDVGMGIGEIKVTGFGYNVTHSAAAMKNGVLTVEIPAPQADVYLQVAVRDNALHETMASVTGLSVSYGIEQEPNNNPLTAQHLSLPIPIQGSISPMDAGTCDLTIANNYPDTSCTYHTAQDYFTFTVPESGNYRIELEFNGNGATTDLDIYLDYATSGSGWWAFSTDDNGSTKIYTEVLQKSLVTNETYTLAVQAWPSWTETASYRLTISKVQ
jgi:hypothetical protein